MMSVETILNAVMSVYGIEDVSELTGKSRPNRLVDARMTAAALFIKFLGMDARQIAKVFHRDRTTAIYYTQVIGDRPWLKIEECERMMKL